MMIEAGNKVTVRFTSKIFLGGRGISFDAEVLRMPRGEGDLIQVKALDGEVYAINPASSDFLGLQKIGGE
jgi:hypothetical protein